MIRLATVLDLDGIEEGYSQHFLYEEQHGAYTVFKEGVYPTRKNAEIALQNQALYIYELNSVIAGSLILDKKQPDEYSEIDWPSKATSEQVNVIHLLMVNPLLARKGIGSALINHAIEIAKSCSCRAIRLDTGKQNIPAVSLYKKIGFQVVAISKIKVGGAISHATHLFLEKIL